MSYRALIQEEKHDKINQQERMEGAEFVDKEVMGTVVLVKKQWWLKINTKPVRMHPLDGAVFPHIITVRYTVDGKDYTKRKWIGAGRPVPELGSFLNVAYCAENPGKAKIL